MLGFKAKPPSEKLYVPSVGYNKNNLLFEKSYKLIRDKIANLEGIKKSYDEIKKNNLNKVLPRPSISLKINNIKNNINNNINKYNNKNIIINEKNNLNNYNKLDFSFKHCLSLSARNVN